MSTTQCEMIIGFLTPHRCDKRALGRCAKCSRDYCEEHLQLKPDGLICLACAQGLTQPVALAVTAQSYDAADLALFTAASTWDEDDTDQFADLS